MQKKKKQHQVISQLIGCFDKFVKKSKIDQVAQVKNSQDSFSNTTYQISEQEVEATGTSESFFINEEVIEDIEISYEISND